MRFLEGWLKCLKRHTHCNRWQWSQDIYSGTQSWFFLLLSLSVEWQVETKHDDCSDSQNNIFFPSCDSSENLFNPKGKSGAFGESQRRVAAEANNNKFGATYAPVHAVVGCWVSAAPADREDSDWSSPITSASKGPHLPHFHHNEPRLQLWLLSGTCEYTAVVTLCQHSLCAGGHQAAFSLLRNGHQWKSCQCLHSKNTFHAQSRLGLHSETPFLLYPVHTTCEGKL